MNIMYNEKHHEMSDQIKENEVVGAYGMWKGDKKSTHGFGEETLREENTLKI
jgi:hypothetical protein